MVRFKVASSHLCVCGDLEANICLAMRLNLPHMEIFFARKFLHQEQSIPPYCLLSALWISDLQVPILYKATKGCEVRSPRPDDARLGLLQGIKCEITLVLMRTWDIS